MTTLAIALAERLQVRRNQFEALGGGFGGIGDTTLAVNFARHCRLVADNPYVILPSSKG